MSNAMSTGSLPPLRNLPSWSRVGILDRARYPRPFPSDCAHEGPASDRDGQKISQSKAVMDGARVASLEKDILFLQQTHKSTLEKLHEEIESLKRANKELQYRLIMDSHPRPPRDSSAGGLHGKHSQTGFISSQEKLDTAKYDVEQYGGIITSLLPLKIHSGQSRPPRTPTLQECEAIIQQLYNTNTLQSRELLRLKAMLNDAVLNKKKISSEVSILTKAYTSGSTSSGELEHFPKLPLRPLPKIQQPSQASVRERVILPAIRPSLRSSMTERQKRAQDVHKTRLRRAVNS
ncbi:coiled-coil domain-containing protein 74A isoform X1 [Pygocentrus nattereri]|nr:coiled-coil domain-containing protein 74A isoform X1 [Pygocentrus nattereri]